MKSPFVPTHRVVNYDAPDDQRLKTGLLVRQINPFASGSPSEPLRCLDERDWQEVNPEPWLLVASEVEPLPNWPEERQQMIDAIVARSGGNSR